MLVRQGKTVSDIRLLYRSRVINSVTGYALALTNTTRVLLIRDIAVFNKGDENRVFCQVKPSPETIQRLPFIACNR